MKKNLRLRQWVKDSLFISLGICCIAIFIVIINSQYNNAIDDCVKSGHEYNYCVKGLK